MTTIRFPSWADDLEIRERELTATEPRIPSVAQIEAMLSCVEFWCGVEKTRLALIAAEPEAGTRGAVRAWQIQAELLAGKPIAQITGYQDWLAMRPGAPR